MWVDCNLTFFNSFILYIAADASFPVIIENIKQQKCPSFDLWSPGVEHQPPHPVDPLSPCSNCEEVQAHTLLPLEWQWNWISPGWLKHVGLCEPVSGVRVHHLSQSAGCVMYPGKWGCCGSADGAAPRWWKCIHWRFFFIFFLWWETEGQEGRM